MSIADAICCRIASSGNSAPMSTMVSIRDSISRQEFACPVDSDPSCPLFKACSMSSASAPRISPTIIRSGLIRKLVRIKSRIVIAPFPSTFAFRVSMVTTFSSVFSRSSAASSIVMIRSSFGMKLDNTFKSVVFPEAVPPQIKILYRCLTSLDKKSALSWVSVPH